MSVFPILQPTMDEECYRNRLLEEILALLPKISWYQKLSTTGGIKALFKATAFICISIKGKLFKINITTLDLTIFRQNVQLSDAQYSWFMIFHFNYLYYWKLLCLNTFSCQTLCIKQLLEIYDCEKATKSYELSVT